MSRKLLLALLGGVSAAVAVTLVVTLALTPTQVIIEEGEPVLGVAIHGGLTIELAVNTATEGIPPAGATYTMRLSAKDDSAPMPDAKTGGSYDLTVQGSGEAKFPPITYTNLGQYEYSIRLMDASGEGASYKDNPEYTVRVWITREDNDEWKSTVTIHGSSDGTKTTHADFKVTYPMQGLELRVAKVWVDEDDNDGLRPDALNFLLLDASEQQVGALTLLKEDDWAAKSITVPATDDKGNTISYHWVEEAIDGYTGTSVTDDETRTSTFTNTHEIARRPYGVMKVWDDDNNAAGARPEVLHLRLMDGETEVAAVDLTAENGWQAETEASFPVYRNGEPIQYTWLEDTLPGYSRNAEEDVVEENITTVTNHYDATHTYIFQKVWNDANDNDGKRPQNLSVYLIGSAEGSEDTTRTLVLNAANEWTARVTVPVLNAAGRTVSYSWREDSVTDYTGAVSAAEDAANSTTTVTFTNTHVPETGTFTVTKIWDDQNNAYGMRPASLTVTFITGETVTLNAQNGWTASIENVPLYSGGRRIEDLGTLWREAEVLGYTQSGYMYYEATRITNISNIYRPRPAGGGGTIIPPGRTGNPTPITPAAATVEIIEDYDTPLAINVDANNVGNSFD